MDREPGVLPGVLTTLGRDGVLLVWETFPSLDLTILKHGCPVTEYEVYGTRDRAFSEELSVSVRVESVLVSSKGAPVEGR